MTAVRQEAGHEQSQNTDEPVRPAQTSLLQDILSLLIKIFIILGCFTLLFTFLFGIFSAKDMSMKPGIRDGDLVVFYRLKKEYVASDVLVLEFEGRVQTRRVVAVAGDTVDITEEGVYINGSYIMDEVRQETLLYENGVEFPLTVPEGHVFVLSDTRRDAIDSRIYGPVAIKDVLGKVTTVIRLRDI